MALMLRRWIALGIAGLLAGCQSTATAPRSPKDALVAAQESATKGEHSQVMLTLSQFGPERLSVEDQALWHLLMGRAMHATGDSWAAFDDYLRDFIRDNRFLDRTPALAELTYEIGEYLANNGSDWLFVSDRDRGVVVLGEFVSLYPTNPHMPDALHRLGEIAYEDGRFDLARERFTQIITGRFSRSIWNTKAAFRVAMCYFRRLEGPEYDLEEMNKAHVELTDFLNSKVESPGYRKEAQEALVTVRHWLAEKHLGIALFYREIENQAGFRHHLARAARDYPLTPAGRTAEKMLREPAGVPEALR